MTGQASNTNIEKRWSKIVGICIGYLFCYWLCRLVFITLVTFTYMHSNDSVQKAGDVLSSNLVPLTGVSALFFILTLHALYPLTQTRLKQVFSFNLLKTYFPTAAIEGVILAAVLTAGLTLSDYMSYLGIYIRFDEIFLSLTSLLFFAISYFLMCLVEEYLLRGVIEPSLENKFPIRPYLPVLISSLLFLVIKYLQFEMGWVEFINFLLLNIVLSSVAKRYGSFFASAGFGSTFLILTHNIFSLPFLGQDMPGVFLFHSKTFSVQNTETLRSYLSGGGQGPESGFVLSVLFIIYLYLPRIRSHKK